MPNTDDIIQGYHLVSLLDRGEFGEVWEAYPPYSQEIVALKLLHPEYYESVDQFGPSVTDRLRREAEILMQVEHPGVVRVIEVIDVPDIPLLGYAMEKLEGSTLEKLETEPGFSSGILIYIFRQVAEALAHLHKSGIVHRDIKASNIFVCDPTRPGDSASIKIIDFGLAKALDAYAATRRGSLVGTLENLSPEALTGDPMYQSGAADQWAWGVTMFRSLTGRPPFHSDELLDLIDAIRNQPLPPIEFVPAFRNDADAERLIPIVKRCLEKDPSQRFRDMEEVALKMAEIEDDVERRRHKSGELLPLQTLDLLLSSSDESETPNDAFPRPEDLITENDSVIPRIESPLVSEMVSHAPIDPSADVTNRDLAVISSIEDTDEDMMLDADDTLSQITTRPIRAISVSEHASKSKPPKSKPTIGRWAIMIAIGVIGTALVATVWMLQS